MYPIIVSAALTVAACGGRQSQVEGPAQPLEERRALQVIADAIQGEGLTPTPGRTIVVATGANLEMDVGVDGHRYGVAYTLENERAALGTALPARQFEGQLQLVQGVGHEEGTRALVLHATDYMLDDHLGTDYEANTITAERKLGRDVRDFIVEAKENRWP